MNNKDLFKNFYNDLYKEILDEYYLEIDNIHKKSKKSLTFTCVLFSIIPTILFWIIFFNKEYLIPFIIITIIYNISVILFIKSSHKDDRNEILNQIKYKILDDMITLITNEQDSEIMPNNRISQTSFERTNLFNLNNVHYTGSNYIQTSLDSIPIVLGDMNIYTYVDVTKEEYFYIGSRRFKRTYKTKKKKDIFVGCYIGSNMNRKNDSLIQIVPKNINNIINKKINNYYNFCPIELKLENLDFSKRYSVYSNDEIKARMVLTLTMMESINELENILDNKKYIIFKNDGRYSIFIENFTFEDILNKHLTNKRNKNKEIDNIYNIYSDLSKLFEIVSILNNSK